MARATVVGTAVNGAAGRSVSPDLVEAADAVGGRAVRSVPRAAPRPLLSFDTVLVMVALAFAFIVRALLIPGDHTVGTDEATYLTSGLNWWAGHGFTTLSGGAELHYPPGLPFLLGGVHELIGGDPHTATVIVNLVTSSLVILPIAGIANLIAGRRAAVLAAWIAALCPAITFLPVFAGGSAGPFTLLVITALWLGLRTATMRTGPAVFGAAGAGLLIGAAYLTRPEGLLFSVVLVPALVLSALGGWRGIRRARGQAWRRAATLVAAFAIPLILLVAPYVSYLHTETGSWELTAKSNAMSIGAWQELAKGDRTVSLREQFGLDRTGFKFAPSQDVGNIIREEPGAFAGIVGSNLNQLYVALFNASEVPYPNWGLLPAALYLLAAFAVWRRRHNRVVWVTVAAIAIPVFTVISYFVLQRYLIPAVALVCALVAVGLLELPKRWIRIATILTFVLLASSTAASLYGNANGWFHPNYPYPERQAVGEWIGDHSRPDDLVMSTSKVVGYYANRNVVPIPWATQAKVINFARHYGVRYLVVDQAFAVRFRPQLKTLLFHNPWKALTAVHRIQEGPRRTVVYELTPRPPKFDGEVPLLDHIGESS
jgi:hypothetical protein